MPTERGDAIGDLRKDLARCEVHEPTNEVEARSANASRVHLLELAIGDVSIDRGHTACTVIRRSQRVDERAVVAAVTRGLHDDVLAEAEPIAESEELFLRCIDRCVFALRCVREPIARAEDM